MPDCLILDTEACRKDDPALHDVPDCCEPPHHVRVAADVQNQIEGGTRAVSLINRCRYHEMLHVSCAGLACLRPMTIHQRLRDGSILRWWSPTDRQGATALAICFRRRAATAPRSAY